MSSSRRHVIALSATCLALLGIVGVLALAGVAPLGPGGASRRLVTPSAIGPQRGDTGSSRVREQADAADDLSWLVDQASESAVKQPLPTRRSGLLAEKHRSISARDVGATARLNSVLAGEAFARAAWVLRRWVGRRDEATGLLPNGIEPEDQAWIYGDTGADLFPHLVIGTHLLMPEYNQEMLGILEAERRLGSGVPDDVTLPGAAPRGLSHDERIFGVSEYAKDGLLPLLERLGPEPWLTRLTELVDAILAESSVPTSRGPIPADSAEVNGNMLQVLARLSWATGEPSYAAAAERIALAYIDVLPTTRYLPPHRWNFRTNESPDRRRFRLSDHGNEILSGLLEWHLAETLRGEPGAAAHREPVRRMLDRILEKGRNPDGLWYRVLEIPSGRVEGEGLTDNYGYLLQAYLTAAIVEDLAPGGDLSRAARYREAAHEALRALPRYRYYEWQKGEMDGYADAIESALYLLEKIDEPEADAWMDEQIAALYGFQAGDGTVLDRDLDGNFIRTVLLYAFARTSGLSLEPWQQGALVGAARDGPCLVVALGSPTEWSGRLLFDSPRHRLYLRLPVDYPRLNKWPEWYPVELASQYRVDDLGKQTSGIHDGAALHEGIALQLASGLERQLRVCPAG